MEISMTQAAQSAALSVLVGVFLGMFYDVIRFFRVIFGVTVKSPFKGLTLKKFVGYIFVTFGDLLFFVFAAVILSVFFFLTGDGRMRSYALAGAFLGFLLYYNTVGRLFIMSVSLIVSAIKRALAFAAIPFVNTYRCFKKFSLQIFNMPIVKASFKRYNEYKDNRKKKALLRARKRRAKKGGYFVNGGTHG